MNQFEAETKNFVDDLKGGQINILVAIRVRPLNQKEQSISEFETIQILEEKVLVLLDPNQEANQDDVLRKNRIKETRLAFDFVFDQWTLQQSVYESTTEFLMNGVLDGYNATILSYGATGSGKTHTMIGTPQDQGIMPRAMQTLFQSLQSESLGKFKTITVKVSFMEIYNENIKDLLTTEDKNLDVREDKNSGVIIAGITEIDVRSVAEVMSLLKIGNKNRSKEATEANLNSSRSHAVLQLQVESKEKNQGVQEQIVQSKLSLVDLAGSERAANTNNKGQRMIEGAKINQSLLVLGNCIQALSEAVEKGNTKPFVPYRNSKLTRLLKDSLGGNCRTVMIASVSPSVSSFEETYNTLIYANRAKNIKTVANQNVLNAQNHISNYAELIKNLRQENEELKHLITNQQPQPQKNQIHLPQISGQSHKQSKLQNKDVEQNVNQSYSDIYEITKKLHDFEDRNDNFQQNMIFLQSQLNSSTDKFDQMRYKERIENCTQQINMLQKGLKDLQRQYEDIKQKKEFVIRIVDQQDSGSFKEYLLGLIKQGELQLENMQIRQSDKRNRQQANIQEQQIQLLKNQLKQNKQYNHNAYPNQSSASSLPQIKSQNNSHSNLKPSVLPGVNSPYPKTNNIYKLQQQIILYQARYQQKRNLNLPSLNLISTNKTISRQVNHYTNLQSASQNEGQRINHQYQGINNRYQGQQRRTPSYHPPSSSKSHKTLNRSLDANLDNSYSVKKFKKMHDDYQQKRFQRAFSGKRVNANQISQPFLNNKILLPGMVHQSPYVKNFQREMEPATQKRERLQKLNLGLKDLGQRNSLPIN